MECLKHVLSRHRPEIINSDQGSHFTNSDYIKLMEAAEVKISMDGQGQALDNVKTEQFFRTLQYDLIYINEFESPGELRKAINSYIHEYNTYTGLIPQSETCARLRFIMASLPKLPNYIKKIGRAHV